MSVDGGLTFNPINGGTDFSNYNVLLLATTAANPQKIYAFGGTTANPVVLGAVNDGMNPINWTANALAALSSIRDNLLITVISPPIRSLTDGFTLARVMSFASL